MEKQRLKVYHVLTDRNIGGAGRWLLNYLQHCNRTRFDVRVVLPKDSLLCEAVQNMDIPVIGMDCMADSSYDKKALQPLKALFQKDKPDIVHTHASLTARMAAKKAGVKKIFHTKHCMEAVGGNTLKRIAKRMVNQHYSDIIIAVSQAVRHSMIAGGTNPKQIVTIYNGIAMSTPLTEEEKRDVLAQYGIPQGQKVVGIAARLEAVKDHNTFLRAAERICKQREDITFLIIGSGSMAEQIATEIKIMQLEHRIKMTGFVSDIETLEAALDLAVITSKEEALCLSLLESMSAGVPAVGTDSGGVSEVICHGENGYLVAVGDDADLAKRILEILSDRSLYESMSKKAMAWTRTHFTAEQMAEKMEKLYLEAIK